MGISVSMHESVGPSPRRTVVGDGSVEPLAFAFWSVRPDIVIDNVARHAAEAGETVACLELPGDYERTLSTGFERGEGPDVFYAQRAEASIWDHRGFLARIDERAPIFAPALRRMDARMVYGARNGRGGLLGLTYYNGGPFALFAHRDFRDWIDLAELTTWGAVLDQLRRARRDGRTAHPFLPRWHARQTGLVWSLLCHLASEGVNDLGASDAADALRAALVFFQTIVDEALIPAGSLADTGDGASLARWAGGRHALTFTMDYLAMDAAALAGTPISVIAPRLPGRTGAPLMPGHALLCLKAGLDARRSDRAQRLLAFLGGEAANGSLLVHERWLAECLFAVPYPELDERTDVRAAMARAFPADIATICVERLIAARRSAGVSPPTHAPWFLEWSACCDSLVRNDLLLAKSISAGAAADALLERWSELASRYA